MGWNFQGGQLGGSPVVIDRSTSTVDVVSTDSETTFYSEVIQENIMGTDKMLRLFLFGDLLYNNSNANTNTIRIKWGGTTYTLTNGSGNAGGSASRREWSGEIFVANLGSVSAQRVFTRGTRWGDANAFQTTEKGIINTDVIVADASENTSTNKTLEVTVQWSASSANNSWRKKYAILELL